MIRAALLAASTALTLSGAFGAPAAAQDFVIVNATVVTGDGSEPVENGMVEVDDGKVVYAGPRRAGTVTTQTVYDLGGKWVTPGMFMAVTDLGLADVEGVSDSNDTRAARST